MIKYSYDDIYGIPLGEYLERHGVDLKNLISKVQIDIVLLKENLKRVLEEQRPYPNNYLETVIYQTIQKKEKHLQHLMEWAIEQVD